MRSTYDIARTVNGGRNGATFTDGRNYWRYSHRFGNNRDVAGWRIAPDGSLSEQIELLPPRGLKLHKGN